MGRVFSQEKKAPVARCLDNKQAGLFKFTILKTEMLKYVWEQFPHVQKSRYGETTTIGETNRFYCLFFDFVLGFQLN